jgi:ribonuclease HIII
MQPNCFVAEISQALFSKLKKDLEEQGFKIESAAYCVFSAKKPGISIALYTSGKLVVQGKEMQPFIEFYLEPEILNTFSFSHETAYLDHTPRIGVDEAGKGDYFGPLSVAGVYADNAQIDELIKIGVKDSKKLSDPSILKMADKIKAICAFENILIFPKRYNTLYAEFKNLNLLLAWGHSKVIETLSQKTGCTQVILDQFASSPKVIENAVAKKGLKLSLVQKHKAETDIVVAAASILARAGFVTGIEKLESTFSHPFPKGASSAVLQAAKSFVITHGKEQLGEVAKLHFKTTNQVLDSL